MTPKTQVHVWSRILNQTLQFQFLITTTYYIANMFLTFWAKYYNVHNPLTASQSKMFTGISLS